jgi:hypothetical protein
MRVEQAAVEKAFASGALTAYPDEVYFFSSDEEAEKIESFFAKTIVTFAQINVVLEQMVQGQIQTISSDEQVFYEFAKHWRKESAEMSSTTEMVMLPPYQSIIGMGPKAVPFIFRELEKEGDNPDNWFWALRYITHANPVKPNERGNRKAMARAWLAWGRQHNARW